MGFSKEVYGLVILALGANCGLLGCSRSDAATVPNTNTAPDESKQQDSSSVALTMKCHDPRQTITSLPWFIDKPGSYIVTAHLVGASSGNGISIHAPNVTIDLNGYTISGNCVGIGIQGGVVGLRNITIRNGNVEKWMMGINLVADNVRLENVNVTDNEESGIELWGYGNLIKECIAAGNQGDGIRTRGARIVGCFVWQNGVSGISAGIGSLVAENVAWKNHESGILLDYGSIAQSNVSNENGFWGMKTVLNGFGSRLVGNVCQMNETGILLGANFDWAESNQCSGNKLVGIKVEAAAIGNLVQRNFAVANLVGTGISAPSGGNKIVNNTAFFQGNDYVVAPGNDLGPVGTAISSSSPFSNLK